MTLEATLRGIVGTAHVLKGGDLPAYEVDWRKRWRGRALDCGHYIAEEQPAALLDEMHSFLSGET